MLHKPVIRTVIFCTYCGCRFDSAEQADAHLQASITLVTEANRVLQELEKTLILRDFTVNLTAFGRTIATIPVKVLDVECDTTMCVTAPHMNTYICFNRAIPMLYEGASEPEFYPENYIGYDRLKIDRENNTITINDSFYSDMEEELNQLLESISQ